MAMEFLHGYYDNFYEEDGETPKFKFTDFFSYEYCMAYFLQMMVFT
jgi:hypothetical protein